MRWLLAAAVLGTLFQAPLEPGLHNTTIEVDGVGTLTYGIWIPRDYDPARPRPLVLALHPGGSPGPGYGMQFLRGVVGPALQDWGAIIVSPDAPDRRWATETSERGVIALLDAVMEKYAIDRDRILVTGFSMGDAAPGTWPAGIPTCSPRRSRWRLGRTGATPNRSVTCRSSSSTPGKTRWCRSHQPNSWHERWENGVRRCRSWRSTASAISRWVPRRYAPPASGWWSGGRNGKGSS